MILLSRTVNSFHLLTINP
uniref:Uncharacterized protein n=1 Tax=Anguilla anguilla TaxID=7936 RepID=A0A0E9VY19_ANGAN